MSKELKVGLLTVLAGIMLYFGFNFLKGSSFISTVNTYYLTYDNVNGLTISNPVVVNGLSVGKVKNLELLQDGKKNNIRVTITVQDQIEVGDGTTAILKSSDLLGGKMILLKLGPNKEIYPSGNDLTATTEKSITEELKERAVPLLENVDSTITKVKGFIDADDKASFKAIVKNMESTSLIVRRMSNESRQNTNLMAGNLIALSAQLRETEKQLSPLIQKMSRFGDSLNTLNFDNTLRNVDKSVKGIDSMLTKINSDQGTVGMLLNNKQAYDSLVVNLANLNLLITHFHTSPNEFLAPLGKKLKKKDPHWDDKRFHP